LKYDQVIRLVFHWIAKWKLDFTDLHIFHRESPSYLTFSVAWCHCEAW